MSHNIISTLKNFFLYSIFILITIFLWYRPFYSIIGLTILTIDFFFVAKFLYLLFKNRNLYYKLELYLENVDNLTIGEIWIEYSKISAFQRIYLLFIKKNLKNIKNLSVLRGVLRVIIIILLRIPVRLIKLSYYFIIENNNGFKEGLINLYIIKYDSLKDYKIEILNNKIYLNGDKKTEFMNLMLSLRPEIKKSELMRGFKIYRDLLKKNDEWARKMGQINLQLIKAQNDSGRLIYTHHYGYEQKNNTIHATSNCPDKLEIYQRKDVAMPSLEKKDAKNPATIITWGIKDIEIIKTNKKISVLELDSIKYNHLDIFEMEKNHYDIIREKEDCVREMFEHGFKIHPSKELLTAVIMGKYDCVAIESDELDFKKWITKDDENDEN